VTSTLDFGPTNGANGDDGLDMTKPRCKVDGHPTILPGPVGDGGHKWWYPILSIVKYDNLPRNQYSNFHV